MQKRCLIYGLLGILLTVLMWVKLVGINKTLIKQVKERCQIEQSINASIYESINRFNFCQFDWVAIHFDLNKTRPVFIEMNQ